MQLHGGDTDGCESKAQREMDGDIEEEITYTHVCAECGHVIGEHWYSFSVLENGTQQVYMMDCILCGHAADTKKLEPVGNAEPVANVAKESVQPARGGELKSTSLGQAFENSLPQFTRALALSKPAAFASKEGDNSDSDDDW